MLVWGLVSACTTDRASELAMTSPELDPMLVDLLAREAGDDAVRNRLRTLGRPAADRQLHYFQWPLNDLDEPGWRTRRRLLLPLMRPYAEAMHAEFGANGPRMAVDQLERISFDVFSRREAIHDAFRHTLADSSRSLQARYTALESLAVELEQLPPSAHQVNARELLGQLAVRMGRTREGIRETARAIAHARAIDAPLYRCQLLGEMSYHLEQEGDVARSREVLREAIRIATEEALPRQVSRLHLFLARSYRAEGRLAAATAEMAVARDWGLGSGTTTADRTEFRHRLIAFYEELGLWDLVGRERELAALGEPGSPRSHPPALDRPGSASVEETLARELQAIDTAALRATRPRLLTDPAERAVARALDLGEDGLARRVAVRATALADTLGLPDVGLRLGLQRARSLLRSGDHGGIALLDSLLRSGAATSLDPASVLALRGMAAIVGGDGLRGSSLVDAALDALATSIARTTPHPELYARIDQAGAVRDAVQLGGSASVLTSYDAELAWRSLPRWIRPPTHLPSPGVRAHGRATSRAIEEWSLATGGVHAMYRVNADHVVCWFRSGHEVWCDTVRIERDRLRADIDAVLRASRGGPHAGSDPPARSIANLAGLVKPLAGLGGDRVLITVDGELAALPFEALPSGEPGSAPLLAVRDVAYFRSLDPRPEERVGVGGLVVCEPRLPPRMTRRYPDLGTATSGCHEVRPLLVADPAPIVVRGPEATHARLLREWTGRAWIYVAAHLIRQPDNPYETFVPLAGPGEGFSALEPVDVLQERFDGTELVVLSACESGVPHVGASGNIPSLAAAFVNAGARAAISTSWRVEDGVATEMMTEFNRRWHGRANAVAILNQIRRGEISTPGAPWAVFRIEIADLDLFTYASASARRP